MSSYNGYNDYKHYLDDLYFNMLEYFTFEKDFTSNLPKNYISTHIICLVDADEIENWKSNYSYDSCLEFFENCDNINFNKIQLELLEQNQGRQKPMNKFKIYETLDEVCNSLKKGGRISVIGNQYLCYVNKITYTKKCFKCYTKNNQLIIYFGNGKSIFIPKFFPDKILDSENVFIVDLPGDQACLVEAIFDNKNKYPNMYESIKSCGSKDELNNKMFMTDLLNYDVNKNELKKFKNYNFYINEEEKNNEPDNKNIYKKDKQEIDVNNIYLNNDYNNNNNIVYNYNNNYYINYQDNGIKENYNLNYIYPNNGQQYYNNEIIDNNININEYPRDSNENINNNIYNNNFNDNRYKYIQNNIPEVEEEKENMNINNKIDNNIQNQDILNIKEGNENKERDEQNNYIEIENQGEEEQEKNILNSNNIDIKEITENKEKQEKEENNKIENNVNENQMEQNNKEEEDKNKSKTEKNNSYVDTESQNQIDQEKAIFYVNYMNNQKTNPELKDLDISSNSNKNNNNNNNIEEKEKEKDFSFKNAKKFPTLGLENISGNNSYINSSLQCLINTKPLIKFFLEGNNINKIPKEDNNNIKLLPSFLQILKKLWTNEDPNLKSINPENFIKNLKQINSSFNKDEENDIGELIIFFIEQIYSELQDRTEYKEENISFIYNTFFGGEKELTTECLKCLNNNNEQEVVKFIENKDLYYLMFRLNDVVDFVKINKIKENKNINIYDCLNYFENPKIVEQNGIVCEKCGNKEEFFITSKILKCQDNLFILLNKNFTNGEKDEDIKFELDEILDMKTFIKDNENNEKLNYYLYGIICLNITFEENKNKIHHVAFCKSPVDEKWYKYDDNIVEPVGDIKIEVDKFDTPVALFYQKSEEL